MTHPDTCDLCGSSLAGTAGLADALGNDGLRAAIQYAVETIDHIANDIYSAVYNDAAWCEEAWEQAHIGGGVA